MKIGELEQATRTKVETIRYYERIGLVPEPSSSTIAECKIIETLAPAGSLAKGFAEVNRLG